MKYGKATKLWGGGSFLADCLNEHPQDMTDSLTLRGGMAPNLVVKICIKKN